MRSLGSFRDYTQLQMAPAPENFVALLDPRTEEITELQSKDEYLRLGSHVRTDPF